MFGFNEKTGELNNDFLVTLNELKSVFSDSIVLDFSSINLGLFNIEPNLSTTSNTFSFLQLDQVAELSLLKNNVDELVKIFPDMDDTIESLDL